MSKRMKGIPKTPEHIENLRIARALQAPFSEETKKKIGKSNTGKKRTAEQNKENSIRNSGSGNAMYGLKGTDHPSFGHICSDEFRTNHSKRFSGSGNLMFGKSWFVDPTTNIEVCISPTDAATYLSRGYVKGRSNKKKVAGSTNLSGEGSNTQIFENLFQT
jgi:hypothetical protein